MVGQRLNDVQIQGFRAHDPDFRRRPRPRDPSILPRYRFSNRTYPSVRKWEEDHTDLRRCARCGCYGDQRPANAGDWLLVPSEHSEDPWAEAWRLCPDCHYAIMRTLSLHEHAHGWVRGFDAWLRSQAAFWPQRGRCRRSHQEQGSIKP